MDWGTVVAHNHVIVTQVLSNFKWRELDKCALVCRTWEECVRHLRAETSHALDFQHFYIDKNYEIHSSPRLRSAPALALLFIDFALTGCFFKKSPFGVKCRNSENCRNRRISLHRIFRYCDDSTKVVGYAGVYSLYHPKITMPSSPHPIMSGCFLPNVDGVNYQIVEVDISSSSTVEEILHIFETQVVKCLLVHIASGKKKIQLSYINNILKKAFPYQKLPFAIGGNVADFIFYDEKFDKDDNEYKKFVLIFMTTSKDRPSVEFDCHSIIMPKSAGVTDFERNVKASKLILRRRRSLMLQFSNDMSQVMYYDSNDFGVLFPNTVMVGCYGICGLIGNEHLPTFNLESSESSLKGSQLGLPTSFFNNELMFTTSTVFVMLQWGKFK